MTFNLYEATVPGFIRALAALKENLKKGEAYAVSRKAFFHQEGQLEGDLLKQQLMFDQFNLLKQVQIACDNAKLGAARIAGVEAPVHADNETTFAELYARIDSVIAFLQTLEPSAFTGKEETAIGNPYWEGKTMPARGYVVHHLVPNFYFHVTTAYAIMRASGVLLGKSDFFGERRFLPA
ncbi:hypothetical protein A3C89_00690 [Candidatus Kaiserbacteria bacterium RIFCSPHIGHO2_02_FULL_50_50]|uniref:DUF1993 domain-containing protein n=1 Tax=Candidatus Kaiserbacteria bacterium RIFCSPHIGHO2_02_FULL_50_50 TaxID=1798492 RepID=A0A1F6DFW4_9BACT|nr:MAG: hypothetical protein A3C89_00690 [Candidatus Kaiserbacteria bacterium RIFCSPHIGHO2_02_FULL_50_50]OGG88869.1 MAG: hypothetical protein A3G62_03130 [Candidatus Kaiserbacteria bacterium RIFCSPLOWO2_12_FULL_50_10]